jgi:phospholipid/cholesterol/gamma-HCH transport system substrate-binding protein
VLLSRFVRIQLVLFAIATVVGLAVMSFHYIQVQTFVGIGKIDVKVNLPTSGGLYRFSNVTYRGIQIGKVTSIDVRPGGGAVANLSIDSNQKIPADLSAEVHSVSAVGEQYLDLRPRTDSAPYLHDGSVIQPANTSVPQEVGPMLTQLNALVGSVPKDKLNQLLDESFTAFNGAGDDLGQLLDSASTVVNSVNGVSDPLKNLIDQTGPLLQTQVDTGDSIRTWAHSLSGFTHQVNMDDPQLRKVLRTGPGFANEVSRLLGELKPTLPILLANLTTLGQVGVTYNAALEQLLVLLPPMIAVTQASGGNNNPALGNLTPSDFRLLVADGPACTVGFLPFNQWRPPGETSSVDTPDGLYCKLPQDSPISVRGARNLPCMNAPGKRAPTVDICYSDKPYVPLAQRQPSFGPNPRDPNLEQQGIPPQGPDVRTNLVPVPDGLPMPESAAGADLRSTPGAPPVPEGPPSLPQPLPAEAPGPPVDPNVPQAVPNSNVIPGSGRPTFGMAKYDPQTGAYLGPHGKRYVQTDLVAKTRPQSWQDLVFADR